MPIDKLPTIGLKIGLNENRLKNDTSEMDSPTEGFGLFGQIDSTDSTKKGNALDGSTATKIVSASATCKNGALYTHELDPEWIFDLQYQTQGLARDAELAASEELSVREHQYSVKHYCMICKQNLHSDKEQFMFHLHSFAHCLSFEMLLLRHEEDIGHQSDYDLAKNYLEKKVGSVHCYACKCDIEHSDEGIPAHIAETSHQANSDGIRADIRKYLAEEWLIKRMRADWYEIDEYFCVPCNIKFKTEFEFASHTATSEDHILLVEGVESRNLPLIKTVCSICSILWYGDRLTYAEHLGTEGFDSRHKNRWMWGFRIPPQSFCNQVEDPSRNWKYDIENCPMRIRRRIMLDLNGLLHIDFPNARARFVGLSSLNASNKFEVFLDFGLQLKNEMANDSVPISVCEAIVARMKKYPNIWTNIHANKSSTSISALYCRSSWNVEMFFINKSVVTPDKLINSLMATSWCLWTTIRYIEDTTKSYCSRVEAEHEFPFISYTILFFLQNVSKLPPISDIIEYRRGVPYFKNGWEEKVNEKCCSVSEWLKWFQSGYCRFYAKFDYQREVMCPWIGKTMKKRDFVNGRGLPEEMNLQLNSKGPHLGEFDVPFCIQDPFGRMESIMKNVNKAELREFRRFCSFIDDVITSKGRDEDIPLEMPVVVNR